ncbi:DnaJ domain [Dillenia turbinata]|uniref:DnaJ domain n=1 Tax=Dillenia turbinata TaxID=194707 RepID=A0AAN8UMP9_9MAGN
MITVCDVLWAASFCISGFGTDWYMVLQVTLMADNSRMEFQYSKLVSCVEPIKNNFPGASATWKLIQDAFAFLSDQSREDKKPETCRSKSKTCLVDVGKESLLTECAANGNATKCAESMEEIIDLISSEEIVG